MSLPRFSIKHPVTTLMLMLICVVVGVVSLSSSSMELMPKMNPPIVVVMTMYPGAAPEEVASLVTIPLEKAAATTSGLTGISSRSMESMSLIVLEFSWGADMSEARADVQQAIDRASLPEDVQKPSLIKFDPNMLPVMELTATGGEDLSAWKAELERDLQPRLEAVKGVASVTVTGAPDPEIRVHLSQERLDRYSLTQSQVQAVIQASNLTYPAGKIIADGRDVTLRIMSRAEALESLRNLVIAAVPEVAAVPATANLPMTGLPATGLPATGLPATGLPATDLPATAPPVTMRTVRLKDVAEVVLGYGDTTVISRTNGRPSLLISIQKEGEANTVEVCRAINAEITEVLRDHPKMNLVTVMDQGDLIRRTVSSTGSRLVYGGLLAVLVLLVFLRGWRPTLIIAVAIPFSVIVTFVLVFLNKLTLNLMTLGGLALGVGMLVDNSIVVIENIHRRMAELRENAPTAAERGAAEVARAITSATLTTLVVFLPVVFVGGLTREIFRELALTVAFSLSASLAVALTVVPMMAAFLLRPVARAGAGLVAGPSRTAEGQVPGQRRSAYTGALRLALRHRAATLVVTTVILGASLALAPSIGTEFMPVTDEGAFTVNVRMPHGTPLSTLCEKVDAMADLITEKLPVELVTTTAGRPEGLAGLASSMGTSGSHGSIKVLLSTSYAGPTVEAIGLAREFLRPAAGDAIITFSLDSSMMGMGGARPDSIQVDVTGPEQSTLETVAARVEREMAALDGVADVQSNHETARPEVRVVVDQAKAMTHGLVPAQVAMTVADAVKGRVVTRIDVDGRTTSVRVVYRSADVEDTSGLGKLILRTPLGTTVRLKEIADIHSDAGPISITRENQRHSIQISGLVEGRDLGSVTTDVTRLSRTIGVPDGYEVKSAGASTLMYEGLDELSKALLLAVLLVYMIMASNFESLLHPFIILFTMPLSVIGVIGGLFLTASPLGITAMIGIIILAGIVVNNGIVLVDFVNQRRDEGLPLTEAIVEAARTRLRPILMTALTTILGLLPLALGIGEGAEMQAPMAIVVIGGLTTSTILTLVVVPVVYHVLAGRRGAPVLGSRSLGEGAAPAGAAGSETV